MGDLSTQRIDVTGGVGAPVEARRRVGALLDGLVRRKRRDEVLLLVSELVTNSVLHGGAGDGGEIVLTVGARDGVLRVTVANEGSAEFAPRAKEDPLVPGGWGLVLVQRVSDRWGIDREGRTEVWFEVALRRRESTAA